MQVVTEREPPYERSTKILENLKFVHWDFNKTLKASKAKVAKQTLHLLF